MNELDDLDIARRLQAHYRETAAPGAPITLLSEVREIFSPTGRRQSLRSGRLGTAVAAGFVVVLGAALAMGRLGIGPSSSGSAVPSSTAVDSSNPGRSASPLASPSSGVEPTDQVTVLRGAAIGSAVTEATDDSPFLIGGRLSYVLADCFVPADFPETPLLRVCGDGLILRDLAFRAPLASDMEATGLTFSDDAIVVRVHTRDPRAADCPPAYLVRCEQAIVVEQVVWRPDAGRSDEIPAILSIVPPQLEPDECVRFGFAPIRCVAVIERARATESIAWPRIDRVTFEPPGDGVSAGSDGLATVVFRLSDGMEQRVEVRCLTFRSASVVCGPAPVPPRPASP